MSDAADARDLLAIARSTMLERVLPALSEAHRYDALMIGNAIGVALRALEAGDDPSRREYGGVAGLVDRHPAEAGSFSPEALAALNAELAAAIRAGKFDLDGEPGERLRRHLLETVRDRLRVDNPRARAR